MEKLRFGMVGADFTLRAAMVLFNYPKDRGELVALCDHNPEMLKKFKEEHPESNAVLYSNAEEMFADKNVEAVFIMVRDQYHKALACAALEAGKAVYLEKPMALSVEECDQILETAYRTKGKLFLGHNMRYVDSILKMKEVIDSGMIGQVQSVWVRHFVSYGSCYFRHWCSHQDTCTGLLLQKGSHDIDIIHWLAGGFTKRVVGMGRLSVYNRTTDRLAPGELPDRTASWKADCWPPLGLKGLVPDMDVEDHNMILMQLDNGVQASYEHCMYTPDSERNYTFIGDKGRVENIGDFGNCEVHVWTSRTRRNAPDIVYKLREKEGGHGGSDLKILEAFFDYVQFGKKPAVSPVAARNAVAAGFMGHKSIRNGNMPMDVPPLSEELLKYFNENYGN
ncbi:MAG: Gfo/Idh/MocA family oxidoreductase [Lentisphaeria bacterium]|nr:Gfo/Idh/MocA family oxidoreductase [Lentisphaeria bacterium]